MATTLIVLKLVFLAEPPYNDRNQTIIKENKMKTSNNLPPNLIFESVSIDSDNLKKLKTQNSALIIAIIAIGIANETILFCHFERLSLVIDDIILTGQPQFGQDSIEAVISFPHSGHLSISIFIIVYELFESSWSFSCFSQKPIIFL